jgi:putative acetyltransferase
LIQKGEFMNLLLRPARLIDAGDINEMRRQQEIRANTLFLPPETITFAEKFFGDMGNNDYVLVG